ncbi:hypothetical protein ACFQVC_32590 [Streptomyces monticola]|uniref:Terpene synthase n=1 Tax=Streptomyces monticola TaxID=2666263 RepID=A0ABW2JRX2_9ACTN
MNPSSVPEVAMPSPPPGDGVPDMPQLTLPFPSRINPHTEHLTHHLEEWAHRWCGAGSSGPASWRAARFEQLVGRMFPTPAPALFELMGEAVVWLFLYDDALDPGGPGDDPDYAGHLTAQLRPVLDGHCAVAPADPLLGSVWWLRHRLLPLVGAAGWRLLAEELHGFSDAMRREVLARTAGRTPTPAEYLAARHATSGWHILTTLVELGAGPVLPDTVRGGEAYRSVRAAAGDVACTVNDLLSLDKERAAGEAHNLVFALLHHEQCDLPAAVGLAHGWLDARLDDYLAARTRLLAAGPGPARPEVSTLALQVSGFEALMRGSLDWSLATGRYGHAGSELTDVPKEQA